MNILNQLSSSLGRRDEVPNQQLAQKIVDSNDVKAVEELVNLLQNSKQAIQNDCIKVLYEIGERNPKMISGYCEDFIALLQSKNNRMVWGAMTAPMLAQRASKVASRSAPCTTASISARCR